MCEETHMISFKQASCQSFPQEVTGKCTSPKQGKLRKRKPPGPGNRDSTLGKGHRMTNEEFLGESCRQAWLASHSDWMRTVGGSRRDSQINTVNSNNEKR